MGRPDVAIAKWLGPPKSYTSGRRSGQPSVIVIHTTEGHEAASSAEDGAAYDKRRTDGTSTHFFVDSNSVVQTVELRDEAHAARTHGNDIGIQIEICGSAAQSSAQWSDAASMATLENVAQLCVQLRKTGSYPLSRLQGSNLRKAWNSGSPRGFCGHVDITNAFPEDNGTHVDPGSNFPWTWLFNRIKQIEAQKEDDIVATAKDVVTALFQESVDIGGVNLGSYEGTVKTQLDRSAELRERLIPDLAAQIASVKSQADSNGSGLTSLASQVSLLSSKLDQLIAMLQPNV
jgi:N-acetyl-anhydromuramyl-L-alanine amidase AmpD